LVGTPRSLRLRADNNRDALREENRRAEERDFKQRHPLDLEYRRGMACIATQYCESWARHGIFKLSEI